MQIQNILYSIVKFGNFVNSIFNKLMVGNGKVAQEEKVAHGWQNNPEKQTLVLGRKNHDAVHLGCVTHSRP